MRFKRAFKLGRSGMNLQGRLIIGFIVAACLTGFVATAVGIHLINKNTIAEMHRTVESNIRTAELIYKQNLERLAFTVRLIAAGINQKEVSRDDLQKLLDGLTPDDQTEFTLDMLIVVDNDGRVLESLWNPETTQKDLNQDPLVRACLSEGRPQSGTILIPLDQLRVENPMLANRLDQAVIKAPQSKALVMRVAVPFLDEDGKTAGVVVGGRLLVYDSRIVDQITGALYGNEQYRNVPLGYAAVFQDGVRVSTNIVTPEGERAVGTIVSDDVYRAVLEDGKQWTGRAFVAGDWYISSYIPIRSFDGELAGMLYTGIQEARHRDRKYSSIVILLAVTTLGAFVALILSWLLGKNIVDRIRVLKDATDAIAAGNLDYKISYDSLSGLDILDDAFNNMAASLKDRDERLKKVFHQLTKTERLAALGQIAAGVAHEINNPLGGILLYSNLILEDLPEEKKQARENTEKIIYQANRCKEIVQNLLDFSRSPSGEMTPLQINRVILTALGLVKDQYLFQGIQLETDLAENLPDVMGDKSRLEQVFLNIFFNAADAMEGQGTLSINTKLLQRYRHHDQGVDGMETEKVCLLTSTNTVKITITDTGPGIDEDFLPHIFEPFFSTKDPGKGTGLGLSITYSIIKKHDGFIDAESTPGEGTTIIIYLPASE